MSLAELSASSWVWLACGAVLVGVAKTGINTIGSVAVVIFAAVVPARESTGAVLPLLLAGDMVAIACYRRHADWGVLARMLPGVLPGLLLGVWFLASVDDRVMRAVIAVTLLAMSAMQLVQRVRTPGRPRNRPAPLGAATLGVGAAAGFATMTANAAGPVTTLYLVMAGMPMRRMLGTAAWFYLVVNLTKLPFSAGLGLVTRESLAVDALLIPAMVAGAGLGILLVGRLRQGQFEVVALSFGALSAVLLLL